VLLVHCVETFLHTISVPLHSVTKLVKLASHGTTVVHESSNFLIQPTIQGIEPVLVGLAPLQTFNAVAVKCRTALFAGLELLLHLLNLWTAIHNLLGKLLQMGSRFLKMLASMVDLALHFPKHSSVVFMQSLIHLALDIVLECSVSVTGLILSLTARSLDVVKPAEYYCHMFFKFLTTRLNAVLRGFQFVAIFLHFVTQAIDSLGNFMLDFF